MKNPNITLSATAKAYIQSMLINKKAIGLRLSIKKAGCSGYSYVPSIINQKVANDILLTIDEIDIYIDSKWTDLLNVLDIDYQEDAASGLKQKRLIINNPKEAGRCGCGESFNV